MDEIDLNDEEEAALERAWEKVGPTIAAVKARRRRIDNFDPNQSRAGDGRFGPKSQFPYGGGSHSFGARPPKRPPPRPPARNRAANDGVTNEFLAINGENEPRDEHGRWTSGGGGTTAAALPTLAALPPDDQVRNVPGRDLQALDKKLRKETTSHLTVDQQDAFKRYSGNDYRIINRGLREGPPPPMGADDLKTVKNMDEALAAVPELKEPVVVYRGIAFETAAEAAAVEAKLDEAAASDRPLTMGGQFVSTSVDPFMAVNDFASRGYGVHLEIVAKKGVYIAHLSANREEREMVLPRDAKFRVHAVKEVVYKYDGKRKTYQLEQL